MADVKRPKALTQFHGCSRLVVQFAKRSLRFQYYLYFPVFAGLKSTGSDWASQAAPDSVYAAPIDVRAHVTVT